MPVEPPDMDCMQGVLDLAAVWSLDRGDDDWSMLCTACKMRAGDTQA